MAVLLRQLGEPVEGWQATPLPRGFAGRTVLRITNGCTSYVFKRGPRAKIADEVANCRDWAGRLPGFSRRVLTHAEDGEHAGYLAEFLDGTTLQQLLVSDPAAARAAGGRLAERLEQWWQITLRREPAAPVYASDIRERLEILFSARAHLRADEELGAAVFERWLDRLELREPGLLPPYTVRVHADLTPDNIVVGPDRVAVFDLARSTWSDPMLDVGKFLAAVRRDPWPAPEDAFAVAEQVCQVGRRLAAGLDDRWAETRLQISCARTLLGSARLVDDVRARSQLREGLALLRRCLSES